jgi:exodeoxyribonuclease V alpha subunit
VQVLTPRRSGIDISAEKINPVLRNIINPGPASIEKNFRKNDRVICVQNNWNKNISNGEIGIVINQPEKDKGTVVVRYTFEGGITKDVSWSWLDANIYLEFAYCLTVHKSQGSEYDTVILLLPYAEGSYDYAHVNLLYTAITRAKEKVIVIGSKSRLAEVAANKQRERRSRLLTAILAGRSKSIA